MEVERARLDEKTEASVFVVVSERSVNNVDDNEEAKADKWLWTCWPRVKGIVFALLTSLAYSLSGVLAKRASLLTGNEQLTIAFAVSFVFMVPVMRSRHVSPCGPPEARTFLCLAAVASLVSRNAYYMSLMLIAPSDTLAIANSSILLTALLARLFFAEKLTLAHLLALLLIVVGVLFIAKPSFLLALFASSSSSTTTTIVNLNNDNASFNSSSTPPISERSSISSSGEYGVALALLTAFVFSLLGMSVKKACMQGAHWSVVTAYGNYFGVPGCVAISVAMYAAGLTHQVKHDAADADAAETGRFVEHLAWSCASAVLHALGTMMYNVALSCEEATKVFMVKASDVLMSFVIQWLVLGIVLDVWSLSGSLAILVAVMLILSAQMLEPKSSSTNNRSVVLLKILTFKF